MKIFSPILKGTTTVAQGTTNLSGSFTGSLFGTAATASYADNFTVGGTLTAQTINVQIITSSIEFNTGSTRNGALSTNTHEFTGSVLMSGSLTVAKLLADTTLDGDPQLGFFTNASTGSSAEAVIYIKNGATTNDATFVETTGTGFTTTGGFVQDGGIVGTGTALAGGLSLMVRANADMRFYTNGHTNERMRITSGGVVNIGKTDQSGNAVLTVKSPAGGNTGVILIEGDTTNDGWGMYATTADEYRITRFTNGSYSDKVIIASSGAVTVNNILTSTRFYASTPYFGFFPSYNSVTTWEIGSDASYPGMYFYNGNGYVFRMTLAGAATFVGGVTSDRRVKENISYITSNTLSFINELKPCSYGFIGDNNDKTRRGFIAQDVLETSIPNLVLGDGEKEGGTYGLDYDGILALAVKSIQELKSENDTLKEILQRNNIQ